MDDRFSETAMEAHHASLGRQRLEEIRQKRAAEKVGRVPSGSDLPTAAQYGMKNSDSANRLSERDLNGVVYQMKELEKRNAELESENKRLQSMVETKEIENKEIEGRLNVELNSLASLRKSLHEVQLEKDAAVISREDLSTQVRLLKKRLKEAEEEQYRAEEDAASLRSELNSLQQQLIENPLSGMNATVNLQEQIRSMEKEIDNLKSMLLNESMMRQQEQQKLAEEQLRSSTLIAEKEALEQKLASFHKVTADNNVQRVEEAVEAARKAFSLQDKEKLEQQLHDMAVMVERLESGRQKLLLEIDSQSSEIERLFEENSNLSISYQDAMRTMVQWENQVKECLKQNEELRGSLDRLRMEQAVNLNPMSQAGANSPNVGESSPEILSTKMLLAKEQSRAEALSAEVIQLSAQLTQTVQAYNSLTRIYNPILRNIESNLMKMKQESFVTVQ